MRYGLIALAGAGVFGFGVSAASAQVCGYDETGEYRCVRPAPNYAPQYEPAPPPYYRGEDRGGDYSYRSERRNPCPPYWTVQSGVCKPYRGY